ncbi:sugar transferase [Acidimicrobiaceae bacterium]|nr:sugar transferase [Acidimicrobiaceae bacterium]
MKLNNIFKYLFRFALLQTILTSLTIFYFDSYLISNQEFKQIIYQNLVEDTQRFFPFVRYELITVDTFFSIMVFFFLIILYSTKFYTYVNELSFSINRNLLDEYFQIYLLWTSYLFMCFYVFRFENVSRGYLFLFSFIVPLILLLFRNPEFISSLLGRSVTNENYLSINLDDNSNFRNLRIITFRKNLGNFEIDINNSNELIDKIDDLNKLEKINLIIINLEHSTKLKKKLEKYLIEVNKKVLLISNSKPKFNANFIYREEVLDETFFTYFNNDIQYGAKYIIKRFLDIALSIFGIIIFLPIMLIIAIYIAVLDGFPFFIKQKRVGLHGEIFNMYKFRTMRKDSHKLRESLNELNKSDGPLFKIENDPRIIKSLGFVRKYSLDEILQFFNVLKGNMSIVGPRPLFDDDTQLFETKYMRRLNVLPGITGLLQINERNTSEFETWYKYDIEYIENWSLYLDLKIILKTPKAIFSKKIKGL